MPTDLELASERREDELLGESIDRRVNLLLSNYQRVTANPRSMGYLRNLLKHYAKSPTPWRACYKDNLKRFGPQRTAAVCGVLKDTIRQSTHWRGKHNTHDSGAPGVAIANADAAAAKGHHLSELDLGEMAVTDDICLILEDLGKQCDIYRVLIGLDDPPYPSKELEKLLV